MDFVSHNSVQMYAEQVRSDNLSRNLHRHTQVAKIGAFRATRATYVKHYCIQTATLDFNNEGTPVSRQFDDVYFSNDNGLEETRYVFLDGNQLGSRFVSHESSVFIVAESGFGTGLNFLTLWQAFEAFRQDNPQAPLQRLHFISFEKYPLQLEDLIKAHQQWPQLAHYAQQLQQHWPLPFAGCHRVLLNNGAITLDLWFGDINTTLPLLDPGLNQTVDAWFLDGFAPSRNPDMWNDTLFNAMARLAKPGGTLATFTSAGFVRRGLQEAGFTVQKRKGFGRKREMLTGVLEAPMAIADPAPWYSRQKTLNGQETAILGGGIASALLALALLRRGWKVTLYCKDESSAQGASGNRQGALYPLLNPHDPALATFFPAAFTFARQLYDTLPVEFDHDWCGVTLLGWDEKSAQKITQMLTMALPEQLARAVNADEVHQHCGIETGCGGIEFHQGGWLCPAQLTQNVIALGQMKGLTVHYGKQAVRLEQRQEWHIDFADGQRVSHNSVVLATGHHLHQFPQTAHLPVYPVAGQVSHIPTTPGLQALRHVLCYDGYLTPHNPANQHHCIGASYHRGSDDVCYSDADQHRNRQRLIDCLPDAAWAQEVDIQAGEARNGVRCATRDHLPMVGNVPDYDTFMADYMALTPDEARQQACTLPILDDLFVLGALGSRGLCSAPLLAEILAAQMSHEPVPLDKETLAALNPARLWIRKWLKGKPVVVK